MSRINHRHCQTVVATQGRNPFVAIERIRHPCVLDHNHRRLIPIMPLYVARCLPHTSFLGFFAAFSANTFPSGLEILYIFYSYNATNYIGYQAKLPSFWFRLWRPGYLFAGLLYDICMLAYCISTNDVTAVLVSVRIAVAFYQLSAQYWLMKHWIPFFVEKEKRRLIFLRMILLSSVWWIVVGSTSWTGSWQERNNIFASVYYISYIAIYLGIGGWYLIQGGIDFFFKYRFQLLRNIIALLSSSGMILGIIGLSIGDGGGNNLVETLNYHSAFVPIYSFLLIILGLVVHYFVVVYEELSWKYQNPEPEDPTLSPSTTSPNELQSMTAELNHDFASTNDTVAVYDVDVRHSSNALATMKNIFGGTIAVAPPENQNQSVKSEATYNFATASNKVACDSSLIELATTESISKEMVILSLSDNQSMKSEETYNFASASNKMDCDDNKTSLAIEFETTKSIPKETVKASASHNHRINIAINDTIPSNEGERMVEEENGNEAGDLEAAHDFVSPSATSSSCDRSSVSNPSVSASLIQIESNVVPYHTRRRNALSFDGITRRKTILRNDILTHQIIMVRLKRHELVLLEIDKLFCISYQLLIWEIILWLAQIFLTLYLQSVNTPIIPGQDGYYCQTPLQNVINSAQFANDLVFARR